MLLIGNNQEQFILDLNEHPYDEHTITIASQGRTGNHLPWGVEMVSCGLVSAEPAGSDALNIHVDIENLDEECFILLKNYNKERIKIMVKPNNLLTIKPESSYNFRISKKRINGRKVNIKILSKEDDNEVGWKCTYDGKPLHYSITPMESNKSDNVTIEVLDELFTEMPAVIEFTQEKSGKVIELKLKQTNNNTEIIKAD